MIKNADDIAKGEELKLPILRSNIFFDLKLPDETKMPPGYKIASMASGPRIIKSHLPLKYWKEALDKSPGTKVIQTIRNPKDTLISMYHFLKKNKLFGWFNGSWNEFFEGAMKGHLAISGDYFDMTAEWYKYNKQRANSFVLIYEEMMNDHRGHVKKIADFLGESVSERILDLITEKTSFANMVKNPKLNPSNADLQIPFWKHSDDRLLRKGEVGQWKDAMDEEQIKLVDEKSEEILAPLGLNWLSIRKKG